MFAHLHQQFYPVHTSDNSFVVLVSCQFCEENCGGFSFVANSILNRFDQSFDYWLEIGLEFGFSVDYTHRQVASIAKSLLILFLYHNLQMLNQNLQINLLINRINRLKKPILIKQQDNYPQCWIRIQILFMLLSQITNHPHQKCLLFYIFWP